MTVQKLLVHDPKKTLSKKTFNQSAAVTTLFFKESSTADRTR
jgi:hypothetical protein